MIIDNQMLEYVAALAKLSVQEDERDQLKTDLEEILAYIEKMKEFPTDEIEPMTHVLPLSNVFREDEVTESSSQEEILAQAPEQKDGCFVVPKTVE